MTLQIVLKYGEVTKMKLIVVTPTNNFLANFFSIANILLRLLSNMKDAPLIFNEESPN